MEFITLRVIEMLNRVFGAALILVFAGSGAQAQSYPNLDLQGRNDVRATASVTIPLGARRGSDAARPRLDFAMQSSVMSGARDQAELPITSDLRRRVIGQTRVSFTLEQNPRLLMNGNRIVSFGSRLTADEDETEDANGGGGNTALYVIGGILTLGVVGSVALYTDGRDALSDLVGPED